MKKIDESYFVNSNPDKPLKVEDLLEKDEKILWKGTPKRASYILQNSSGLMPFALLWLLIDGGIIFGVFASGQFSDMGGMGLILIPFFALHLMPVWIWIGSIIKSVNKSKRLKYYITNKRIIEVSGKVAYIKTELKIKDITSSNIKKSVWDKLFKVADIYISGEEGSIILYDIPNGEFICSKLSGLATSNEEQEEFYEQGMECEHCGSYCSKDAKKCPNCGAGLIRK